MPYCARTALPSKLHHGNRGRSDTLPESRPLRPPLVLSVSKRIAHPRHRPHLRPTSAPRPDPWLRLAQSRFVGAPRAPPPRHAPALTNGGTPNVVDRQLQVQTPSRAVSGACVPRCSALSLAPPLTRAPPPHPVPTSHHLLTPPPSARRHRRRPASRCPRAHPPPPPRPSPRLR